METDASYLPTRKKSSIFARIIALVALVGTIVVVYVVISGSLSIDDDGSSSTTAEQTVERENQGEIPKKYTVGDGESLSSIAEKYDISVKRIERLNKGLDPNTLATGQVIILH